MIRLTYHGASSQFSIATRDEELDFWIHNLIWNIVNESYIEPMVNYHQNEAFGKTWYVMLVPFACSEQRLPGLVQNIRSFLGSCEICFYSNLQEVTQEEWVAIVIQG